MDARTLAAVFGRSLRTAQRWLERWRAAQHHDRIPRVALVRARYRGRGGRPHYIADAASVLRWASPAT